MAGHRIDREHLPVDVACPKLPERALATGLFNAARLVIGTVLAVLTLRWAKSLDGVILAGTVVYLLTLFLGYWSTYAYFAAIGPILCWRIDDWLHVPTRPLVALPGDPGWAGDDPDFHDRSLDRKAAAT